MSLMNNGTQLPTSAAQASNSATAPTSPVTVLLTDEQTVRLDEISIQIRRQSGKAISRSALIRAMTNALLPYARNFHEGRSEADICRKIARALDIATRK